MATYNADLNASGNHYTLQLVVNQSSQNIATNTSVVSWSLTIYKGSGSGRYSGATKSWSVNIGGNTASGSFGGYDFRGYSSLALGSGSYTITHAADGTKTISNSGSFSEGVDTEIGGGTASGSLTLTTIPRATQPTVSPTSGNTGGTFTIGHTPATSSFYHDISYTLDGGGSYTAIATNVVGTTTSTTWTPAHSLIPNATSVTAVIQVITRASSGGTVIGTKTVNLPLTVPSSVKPTISSVAWVDTQTSSPDIPTLMGGTNRFVQGWSKLQPTVSSAGAGGASIVSSSVTQGGQTTPSGTAFGLPVSGSGSVSYSATAIDSRGVNSDTYVNTVAVTAYNFPNLPTPLVMRTSDAAGLIPSPTGTYLAITPGASVSSLLFSAVQKNLLEWQVRTKPVGGSYTTIQAWTNATVSGTTWTTKFVTGGSYAANTEYVVEVSIRDLFGKNGFSTSQTVVALEIPVASEAVFMDWNGTAGIGLGRYHTNGMFDVEGTIYQNAGNIVLDEADIATNAETITGASASKVVSPAGLTAALGSQDGYRLKQTVLFTSSGTFTKATYPWLRAVRVRLVGGGGGGAGAAAPGAGTNISFGNGGGGGGYAEALITVASLGTTETVTVGAGGSVSSGGAGGGGGSTSFGSLVAANGGGGGSIKPASVYGNYVPSGTGGIGTAGDLKLSGDSGTGGSWAGSGLGASGSGGGSMMGGGGAVTATGSGSTSLAGEPGQNYGGGGGGGSANTNAIARAGGAGAPGVVIVELYS